MMKSLHRSKILGVALAATLATGAAPAAAFSAENADSGTDSAKRGAEGSLAGTLSPSGEALACTDADVAAARQAAVAAHIGVERAQAECDAAASSLASAEQALADGAFSFFGEIGAAKALAALEAESNPTYSGTDAESLTRRGAAGDATGVDNMLAAIPYLKQCNEIRAANGLEPLKVGVDHMAFAMWNANWSDTHGAHAGVRSYRSHECLAWGADDPFDAWYTQEKALADAGDAAGSKDYGYITSKSNVVAGYAVATHGVAGGAVGYNCHSQLLAEIVQDGEATYTVDEYEALLKNWVEGKRKAVSDAQAALDTAQAALAAAQAACDAAQAALEAAEAPYSFADVDYSLYYGANIAKAAKDGLMSGYSGTADFGPEDVMTRGQLATVLWRAACPDAAAAYDAAAASNETGMADVEAGKYYTAAANWAVENGVINGFEVDGHREFRPYDPVTMEQLCCIAANFRGEGYGAQSLAESDLAGFADGAAVSPWARGSVAWAAREGWASGYEAAGGARELRPGEALCRGRAATILENASLLAEHEHEWEDLTEPVWVPELVVVQEAWDEPVYEVKAVVYCGVCGVPEESKSHGHDVHISKGDYSYWGYVKNEKVQTGTVHHDAVTEDRGHYEDKVTGHVCAGCGAKE